jgi:ribosomal protein L37AE/L43A
MRYEKERIECEVCKNKQSDFVYHAENMKSLWVCIKCSNTLSKSYRKENNIQNTIPLSNLKFMEYVERRIKENNRDCKIDNILE